MDAFYEWAGKEPAKQPWAVARADGQEMLVAGIWDAWKAPDRSILRTFAVITTDANDAIAHIHHRMPVIIEPSDVEIWVGDDVAAATALMKPPPADVLRAWLVSHALNDVRRDGPELLAASNNPVLWRCWGLAIDATVSSDVDVQIRFRPERLAGAFQPA
jgi:putative SOS response-associated peptidase YedK